MSDMPNNNCDDENDDDASLSLIDLPPEILCHVVSFLPVVSVPALAQSCRVGQSICDTETVWDALTRREYRIHLQPHSGFSSKAFFQKILVKYGRYLGLWQRFDLEHYGSLHQFYYHDHALHFIEWIPPCNPNVLSNLRVKHFFSIGLDLEHNVLINAEPKDRWLGGSIIEIKDLKDRLWLDLSNCPDLTLDPLSWFEELNHFAMIYTGAPYNRGEHQLLTMQFLSLYHKRTNLCFQRLKQLSPPNPSEVPIRPGLFKGTYGPHGIEIVNLQFQQTGDDETEFLCIKVTGDPNIPFDQVTFKGNLSDFIVLSSDEQADLQCLSEVLPDKNQPKLNWKEHPAQSLIIPNQVQTRSDLPQVRNAQSRFLCQCQIAGHGFRHPQFISGHFLVINDDLFAVLFIELASLSFYHRIQTDLDRVCFDPLSECESAMSADAIDQE
ncbi:hypothetical protein TCAL_06851 [Tigriopus californicus]|uniref:F-box domain-containing protein n=1 Tax=Tigriopus californicus TaxID=6832 RepID=A0A553NDH9_TIGCA|nr:F-box only protein 31-like [Tigriopus californicus]TRY63487.1 hypothetical protein TCAL_06851 [Tigriopus californicus]|eukprot:TCALIF_06851-PA protein Name:"Similar to fbxo31-b F-box only protein 31-B (Xenopus laevis)" AED:0.04 eAED:0.04 QI:0/-1/0/1/-1/1/1/0/437